MSGLTESNHRTGDLARIASVLLVGAVTLTWCIWLLFRTSGYTLDDAFITWRYGQNLVTHGVWNFNPSGENVEAYSSLLYAIASIVPAVFGVNPLAAFKVAGLVGTALFLVLLRVHLRAKWGAIGLVVVLTLANPLYVLNMWSGLETAGMIVVTAGAITYVTVGREMRNPLILLVLLILVSMVRSEGVAYAAVIFVVSLCPEQMPRDWTEFKAHAVTCRGLVIIVGIPLIVANAAYLAFRRIHFGEWGTGPSWVKVTQGSQDLNVTANMNAMLIMATAALACIALLASGRRRQRLLLLWLGFTAIYGVIFLPSNLLMGFFLRFPMMTYWPFVLAAVIAWGIADPEPCAEHNSRPADRGILEVLATLSVAVLGINMLLLPLAVTRFTIDASYPALVKAHGSLGVALRDGFPRDTQVLLGDVGLTPYLSDLTVLDPVGLALPKPWRSFQSAMGVLGAAKNGVVVIPGKSATDTSQLFGVADGSHLHFDATEIQRWAIDRGYVYADSVYYPGYYLQVWLSPALSTDPRALNAIEQARCVSESPGSVMGPGILGGWGIMPIVPAEC